jgi:hypothetical protein
MRHPGKETTLPGCWLQVEDRKMLRLAVTAICLCAFCLTLGCGPSSKDKDPNPDLPHSKEGPPKRGGAPGGDGGPKKAAK